VQVCNDEAAHDQINPNAQEPGGANGAFNRSRLSKNCAADLLDATHCRGGSGASCFAGRDVDGRSFALAKRGRAASSGLISPSSG
jgi:hypothetical protein